MSDTTIEESIESYREAVHRCREVEEELENVSERLSELKLLHNQRHREESAALSRFQEAVISSKDGVNP